jgi:hypothetical protein
MRAGHRVRWAIVAAAVFAWFVALAFDLGGDAVHLLLVVALVVLVYELLVEEAPPS